MLFVKAISRGVFGGYLVLSLLLAAGVLKRLDNPDAAMSHLENARWIPGALRLEMTLRNAFGQPDQGLLDYEKPKRPETTQGETSPEPTPKIGRETAAELTPLQKLRQRTYGDSSQSTVVRKQ